MAPSIGADINTTDSENARPGSIISLSATVPPFSPLLLATTMPLTVCSSEAGATVLDIWLRGSVLIRGALKIQDLDSGRESKPVILANLATATPVTATARLLGPASDDWFRLQVNLASLLSEKNAAKCSETSWNSILFEDISGQGFDIFIDEMRLVPSATSSAAGEVDSLAVEDRKDKCVGTACNPILTATSTNSDLVPLYGGDISAQDATTPSPVIARLKPGVSAGQVLGLCNELTGSGGRFDGTCTLQSTVNDTFTGEIQAEDLKQPVKWPFLAITAKTESDLKAMRSALQEIVEYFDRDKKATILVNSRKLAGEFTDMVRQRGIKEAKKMLAAANSEKPTERERKKLVAAAADISAAAVASPSSEEIDAKIIHQIEPATRNATSTASPPAIEELAAALSATAAAPSVESKNVAIKAYCSSTPWKYVICCLTSFQKPFTLNANFVSNFLPFYFLFLQPRSY
jgi:hypothetical protein